MTDTNTPPFFRAAIGLLLAGSTVGCGPADTGGQSNGGPSTAVPTVAAGGVDGARSELPGGGEIIIDAEWQSQEQDGGDGADGGDGPNANDGGDGNDDNCTATLNNCPMFNIVEVGLTLSAQEAPEGVEVGDASISNGQGNAFTIVDNTCTGFEVSDGSGTCSITVEFSAPQPGRYHAQLLLDIPSHQVTKTIELQRGATVPGTALPTESPEEATADTDSAAPVSPEPAPPSTADTPDPQVPVQDFTVERP